MKKNGGVFWTGIGLLVVGLLVLAGELNLFSIGWDIIWPLVILILGLCFHIGFALGGGRSPGILVPGGILITYGLLFFACTVLSWRLMSQLWPVFIIGPGIGLLELYLFSGKARDRALLVPVGILFALGGTMLVLETALISWDYFLPVVLIMVGLLLLLLSITRRRPVAAIEIRPEGADFMSAPSYRPSVTPIAPPSPVAPPVPESSAQAPVMPRPQLVFEPVEIRPEPAWTPGQPIESPMAAEPVELSMGTIDMQPAPEAAPDAIREDAEQNDA